MSEELIKQLRSGEQVDRDGVMVKVSRQACEEAADHIAELERQLAELRAQPTAQQVENARDAALYRWLIENLLSMSLQSGRYNSSEEFHCPIGDSCTYKYWDRVITAALQAGKEKE